MTPHCVTNGDVKQRHLETLLAVREFVDTLPDELTCHEVCARVATVFSELEHWRGKFNHFDHSWTMFRADRRVILDPYPWACASGPLLVTTECLAWATLYHGVPINFFQETVSCSGSPSVPFSDYWWP